MSVNLAMKRLIYYNLPRKPFISLSVLRAGMSSMTLIFSGSTSIPHLLTICPSNFLEVTPKVYFLGFNCNLNMSSMTNLFWINIYTTLADDMPQQLPRSYPNVHFLGFNRDLNCLSLSKNLYKAARWSTLSQDFTIMSSTYTSTSFTSCHGTE